MFYENVEKFVETPTFENVAVREGESGFSVGDIIEVRKDSGTFRFSVLTIPLGEEGPEFVLQSMQGTGGIIVVRVPELFFDEDGNSLEGKISVVGGMDEDGNIVFFDGLTS